MKKFILIPDSFKGTMSSTTVCTVMKTAILNHYPDAEIVALPIADGGEGSVDAFTLAMKGEKVFCHVKDPFFNDMEAFYGKLDATTAIIEMSACAGLPLVIGCENPLLTTTFGVGELIDHAISNGAKKIILGLGGSCTNDAGVGAAAALGCRFFNSLGESFIPTGGTLKDIYNIDFTSCHKRLRGIEFITICDIDNPLYGKNGAAYIFAPQKGATPDMVLALDEGLKHFSDIVYQTTGQDIAVLKGSGAAGGMGAGSVIFFNAKLQMGIDTILDVTDFDTHLKDANVVFTGEGKIDTQSLNGKVVLGVCTHAQKAKVPVIAVVGSIGDGIEPFYDKGIHAIISINKTPLPFEIAKLHSTQNLAFTMDSILRLIKLNL